MKIKIIFIGVLLLVLCGCQNVKNLSTEEITTKLATSIEKANTYHTGYKYYVPKNMQVTEYMLYNDIISSDKYTFYLYVDVISFYNKTVVDYQKKSDIFYSSAIKSGDKYGYLEISLQENNQYLIEIMYNYAKIEVMVDYEDINPSLMKAVSILRSIEYNESIIANILGDDILTYQEEVYDIFNTINNDGNSLKYVDANSITDQDDNEIKDTDFIN